MLLANCANVFLRRIPMPLAHNQGDVLRGFDFPAPVFQFLIGVSLVLFLQKRRSLGRTASEAQRDALRRFALIIVLGVLLDTGGSLTWQLRWGVLQTLGLGGMVATLLAGASPSTVAGVALALLGIFSGRWNGEVHAGPIASLAFAPLTLMGLLVGQTLESPAPRAACLRATALVAAAAGGLGIALYVAGIPFNKVIGTSSFVALATAVAAGSLAVMAALENTPAVPPWLAEVGQNALNVWVLQYLLLYYPAWILFPSWHRLALRPGMVAIVATTAALSFLGVALGRRGLRIPL
jgi:predicted acyltransferase